MHKARRHASEPDGDAGRRKAPRLQTGSVIHARCVNPALRVRELRNLGAGGFSVETEGEVVAGWESRFEFNTLTGFTVTLGAVVVYCRPSETGGRTFISGWCFTNAKEAEEPVSHMLDFLTSALQFDMDDGWQNSH